MQHAANGRPDDAGPSGRRTDAAGVRWQAQAVLAVPPAAVFAALADVARWAEWVPGDGVVRAGPRAGMFEARFHERRFEGAVTAWAAPRRLGWTATGAGVRLRQTWRLTGVAAGTRLVTDHDVRAGNPHRPGPSPAWWIAPLNSLWVTQLGVLARLDPCEGEPEEPAPARRAPGGGTPGTT